MRSNLAYAYTTECANQPSQKEGTIPPLCGQLTVIKQVQGGTAIPSQFVIRVTGNNPSQSSFSGSSSGTTITLSPGSYQVTESSFSGCTSSLSRDCSRTISSGQTKTCIITNTFSIQQYNSLSRIGCSVSRYTVMIQKVITSSKIPFYIDH